jgi:DNA-binding transcriptional ArsR family regulator
MHKRSAKPITNVDDPRYVKALAHPLRIRILAMLEERDASPVQLAEHLDATLGTVAYHVRTLEKLGLIEMVATHQRRGATEHVYAAREHPRISDQAWASAGQMAKDVVIGSVLSQIGAYATRSAAAGGFNRSDAHITRTALKLDERGWAELARATQKWLEHVQRIETATQRRLDRVEDADGFDAGLVIMLFEAQPFFDSLSEQARESSRAPRARRATRGVRRRAQQPAGRVTRPE